MDWKPVGEVMTSSVETIGADDPITDAARTMIDNQVGSLVIVDEDDRPEGILTRTDVVEFASSDDSVTGDGVPNVRSMMTTDVITVTRNTPFDEAVNAMMSNGVHHLPVVDDESLEGIVTTTDLSEVFESSSDEFDHSFY